MCQNSRFFLLIETLNTKYFSNSSAVSNQLLKA